jgi:hypothetical protein
MPDWLEWAVSHRARQSRLDGQIIRVGGVPNDPKHVGSARQRHIRTGPPRPTYEI